MSVPVRPGRDTDGPAMTALIASCWSEYPGCVMDLGENPHLAAPARYFSARHGVLLVAEDEAGCMRGCVSAIPSGSDAVELKGLYVDAAARGSGLAVALLDAVENFARARHAVRLLLWSDTRFARAHRFYERHGFVAVGAIRALGDLSNSLEYPYEKPMGAIATRRLDLTAAHAAGRAFASLLAAAGLSGRSDRTEADRMLETLLAAIGGGTSWVIAGWADGRLAGLLAIEAAAPPAGPHVGRLAALVVHPQSRGRGLGRALLDEGEGLARDLGRTLLVIDMPDEGAGCRLPGRFWQPAGRIPGYARDPDGTTRDIVRFWRNIDTERP